MINRRYALALSVLIMLVATVSPIVVKSQTDTELTYSIYAEAMDVVYGENGAVAVVAFKFGGTIDLGIDFSASKYSYLTALMISIGKGSDWAQYIHKPVWDMPPGIFVMMTFRLDVGYTEDDAVNDAFSIVSDLKDILGKPVYPLWEARAGGAVNVLFYAPITPEEFINFYNVQMNDIGARTGILGMITDTALEASPYARFMIALTRDRGDADRDGNINEWAFGVGVGFIAVNATNDLGDGWYYISLNEILQRTGSLVWSNESNWSIINVRFPFPMVLRVNETTPCNSSFPEVTGRFEYLLHAKSPNPESGWEVSWNGTLEDIKITFKPFNYTELQDFPIIKAISWWDTGAGSKVLGSFSSTLPVGVNVTNVGTSTARNVRVVIPLNYEDFMNFENLVHNGYMEYGPDVRIVPVFTRMDRKVLLVVELGDLAPGEARSIPLLTFKNLDPSVSGAIPLLPLTIGPIVRYTDDYGTRAAVLASGFMFPLSFNGSMVVAEVSVYTPDGKSYVSLDDVVDINVKLTSYGSLPAHNIRYEVWHAIVDERGKFLDIDVIGNGYVEELGTWDSDNPIYEFNHTYLVRTRPGLHVVGIKLTYEAEINTAKGTIVQNVTVFSNFISMFVLPKYRIEGNIFRYPLPYAKLIVDKQVIYNNSTGNLEVTLNITNVGDIPTKLMLVADYWNATQLSLIPESVKINGTQVDILSSQNDKIHVLYVVLVTEGDNITLQPNSSIVIEYELRFNVEGSVSVVSNPTIVKYDFGPYEMVEEETPTGEEESEEVGTEAVGTAMLKVAGGDTVQPVQTYTDALLLTASVAFQPRVVEGKLVILGVLIVLAIAAGVIIRRRKR